MSKERFISIILYIELSKEIPCYVSTSPKKRKKRFKDLEPKQIEDAASLESQKQIIHHHQGVLTIQKEPSPHGKDMISKSSKSDKIADSFVK